MKAATSVRKNITVTPDDIRRFKRSPSAFRESLFIRKGNGVGRFTPDPWQAENLAALDPMWMRVAGVPMEQPELRKFAWLGRARGHSKTMDEAMQLVWVIAFSTKPLNGIAAAGAKDQAKFIRDAVLRIILLNPWLGKTGLNLINVQNYRVFNPKTKSEVDIISSDAPSSFGATPDFILCDELTHWRSEDGKCELWDSLFSSADKVPHCILVIMTNAGYERTWQAQVRDMAIHDTHDWIYRNLDGPMASWMGTDFLKRQKKGLTAKAYARLWLNIWQIEAGDALEMSDIEACVKIGSDRNVRPLFAPEPGWIYVGGLDLSTKRHRSAFVMLAVHQQEHRVKLAFAKSWKPDFDSGKVNLPEIQKEIERLHSAFGLNRLMYDQAQAVLMAQQLEQKGIFCEEMSFNGKGLSVMATTILEAFKSRHVELYRDTELINDLTKLNIVERAFGFKLEASEDQSGHADLAFAFAIALPAAIELSSIVPISPFTDASPAMTLDDMENRIKELDSLEKQQAIKDAIALAMSDLSGAGTDGAAMLDDLLKIKFPELTVQSNRIERTIPCDECGGLNSEKCAKCSGQKKIHPSQAANPETAVMTMALEENGLTEW